MKEIYYVIIGLIAVSLLLVVLWMLSVSDIESICGNMNVEEAFEIALDESQNCMIEGADVVFNPICNEDTLAWWFDTNLEKSGCNPACVVDIENKTAEINWRCTGLIE